jgi:hypothetical protein
VLDGIQAESKRVRESGLCHAKSIADSFYVNLTGHMRPESFLLPSKKSVNVVKAIHHLLELRFHATSRKSRRRYRHVSSARCVPPSTGFLSHSKELVGNGEVSGRLDDRLHNPLVLHWTPSGQVRLYAIGHQWFGGIFP